MGTRLVFAFFTICHFVTSQQVYTDTELKEDFEVLTKVVIEVAPTLKASEKASLYNTLNQRKEKLSDRSMSALDFFIFLKNTSFGISVDEHAGMELPEDVLKSLIPNKAVLFPIPISIQNKKVLVNHESVDLPFGSEISSINGVSMPDIFKAVLRRESSRAFRELEQQFDLAYLIEYGQFETFNIEYKIPNSEELKRIDLKAIDLKQRQALLSNRVYPLNREQIKNLTNTWFDKEHRIYYLQLNSFKWGSPTKSINKDFEKEFNRIFKDIEKQNPKHLIIDIRYNGGGQMSIPGLFYSFVATEEFSEVLSAKIPDFNLPYLEYIPFGKDGTPNPKDITSFLEKMKKPFELKGDYYENEYFNRTFKPNRRAFMGDVTLLISGRTGSAASYFTALFKSQNRGLIVGETIGGAHDNITAVKNIPYILPNTKIKVTMPIGILQCSEEIKTKIPEDKINPDFEISWDDKYQWFLQKQDWDFKETLKHFN